MRWGTTFGGIRAPLRPWGCHSRKTNSMRPVLIERPMVRLSRPSVFGSIHGKTDSSITTAAMRSMLPNGSSYSSLLIDIFLLSPFAEAESKQMSAKNIIRTTSRLIKKYHVHVALLVRAPPMMAPYAVPIPNLYSDQHLWKSLRTRGEAHTSTQRNPYRWASSSAVQPV